MKSILITYREIINTAIIVLIFGLIFSLSILLGKIFPKQKELSRKTAHFLGGLTAAFFPWLIDSIIIGGILSLGFFILLIVSRFFKTLNSIHGVERNTIGSYLFPISIFLMFIIARDQPIYYFISILVLSISDTAAALIGVNYGKLKFEVESEMKTIEGVISFFLVTFLSVHLPLLLLTDLAREQSLLIALTAAFTVTGFELISLSGTDNLFIPIGTYYIIQRMAVYPVNENILTVIYFIITIIITLIIFYKAPHIKGSNKVSIILSNFACLTLIRLWYFFIPLIVMELIFVFFLRLYSSILGEKLPDFKVKYALYIFTIPILLIFLYTLNFRNNAVFTAFLTALSTEIILMIVFFIYHIYYSLNNRLHTENILKGSIRTIFMKKPYLVGFAISIIVPIIVALPVLYYKGYEPLYNFVIIEFLSILIWSADIIVYSIILKKSNHRYNIAFRYKLNMLLTLNSVLISFLL